MERDTIDNIVTGTELLSFGVATGASLVPTIEAFRNWSQGSGLWTDGYKTNLVTELKDSFTDTENRLFKRAAIAGLVGFAAAQVVKQFLPKAEEILDTKQKF